MSPTELLDPAIALLLFASWGYLAWRKPGPGRVRFALVVILDICVSIVACRGRGFLLPYWVGGLLGLIVTPPLYLIWARVQSSEETWALRHDHRGRMPTRSKTFTIPGSQENEPERE
jgi:hypothetical protein